MFELAFGVSLGEDLTKLMNWNATGHTAQQHKPQAVLRGRAVRKNWKQPAGQPGTPYPFQIHHPLPIGPAQKLMTEKGIYFLPVIQLNIFVHLLCQIANFFLFWKKIRKEMKMFSLH
jgi:hypothetical protein